jgi:hypothetical protein
MACLIGDGIRTDDDLHFEVMLQPLCKCQPAHLEKLTNNSYHGGFEENSCLDNIIFKDIHCLNIVTKNSW